MSNEGRALRRSSINSLDLKKYRQRAEQMRRGKRINSWYARRVKILNQCNWCCVKCGRRRSLTIDHRKRVSSREHKNKYLPEECVVLCRKCHEKKNGVKKHEDI